MEIEFNFDFDCLIVTEKYHLFFFFFFSIYIRVNISFCFYCIDSFLILSFRREFQCVSLIFLFQKAPSPEHGMANQSSLLVFKRTRWLILG